MKIFLLFFCFISFQAYSAPIYVYEVDGVLKFSTVKPKKGIKADVFTAKSSVKSQSLLRSFGGKSFKDRKRKYESLIRRTANNIGVDVALVKAVIHAESAFKANAKSKAGALGLMQVMPFNAKRLGVINLRNPDENVLAGTRLLKQLIKKYDHDLSLVLAAYNAGEGAVAKYNGIPPFKETKNYVPKVLKLYDYYKRNI